MKKLLESKLTAWAAMLLVVVMVFLTFLLGTPWWGFIAEFFCFMAVFSHLVSLYLRRMNVWAARRLDTCAFVCLIVAVVGFVAEYVVFNLL
ncbi:MAG: hypothetical protein K2L59_06620 [Muribaculaceae bacterium]|nr:hypothetical protein [Muribaculaceae bacterium]